MSAKRSRASTLVLFLASTLAHAQQDILETIDGGRLIGEIKSLDRGMLRFETDATDTIQVQWTHVSSLTTPQNLLVTLTDGQQLFGSLGASATDAELALQTETGTVSLPVISIVRMTPIEGRLLDRISMSLDVGYNLAKANDLSQTDFSYHFTYRSEERLISTDFDASRSSATNEPVSVRSSAAFSYRRFIGDRVWDPNLFTAVERNDELGLDRRVTLGGGMSRWLTDTNTRRVSLTGGVVATRENEAEAIDSDDSVEAVVSLELDWFRYDDPELDIALRLQVFERLSDTDRTRGELDVDLRWELVSDFFWGFNIYYSFNSNPTGIEASGKDYGVMTSLGWSF